MAQQALFLRWALFASLMTVGAVAAAILGGFSFIARYDPTNISFIIFVMMIAATAWCGRLTWKLQDDLRSGLDDRFEYLRNDASHGYLAVNLCTLIGFLGTILGMIIMFLSAEKGLMSSVGGGHGTFMALMRALLTGLWPAFLTTAVGLVCGAIVLLQYHMLDHAITKAKLDAGGSDASS